MANLNEYPWHKLLRVSNEEVKKWLILTKETKVSDTLFVRFYRLPHEGDKINEHGLINYLLTAIEGYVFDKTEVEELREDGEDPFESALRFFGDVDPIRDGRYGELILYVLTEGILNVPLVVHKIAQSYSPNKQVEGSDGLFIGHHQEKFSLLVGESKMRNVFSVCLPDALNSINRFHGEADALKYEIKIARKHLSKDIEDLDHGALKQLYDSLKPDKPEFAQFNLVHPILLVYKEKDINKIESEVEKALTELIGSTSASRETSIKNQTSHLEQNHIDFFLIPVGDVSKFRTNIYKAFHGGQEYIKKEGEGE